MWDREAIRYVGWQKDRKRLGREQVQLHLEYSRQMSLIW